MAKPRAERSSAHNILFGDPPGTPCEQCGGNGLERVFEHVSYPAHAPAQKQLSVEPFDFERWPRQWEEDRMVHQLLKAFRVCSCPVGQRRKEAMRAREQGNGKKRDWRLNEAKCQEARQ